MLNEPGGGVLRVDFARCLCDRQVRNHEGHPRAIKARRRQSDATAGARFFGVALSVVMEVRLYRVCRQSTPVLFMSGGDSRS